MRRLSRNKRVIGSRESYKQPGGVYYDKSRNSNHHRSRQSYSIRRESIRRSHLSRLHRNFIQCVLHKSYSIRVHDRSSRSRAPTRGVRRSFLELPMSCRSAQTVLGD